VRRDVFQAIADPTRRAIIDMISDRALNLNAVAEKFDISRPAISKHIKILTECGLIIIHQQGRERYCHADLKQLKQVADWTKQFQVFWTQKLDALGAFLEKDQKVDTPAKISLTSKNKRK
jgi:DNA-binding transcriptional ArsR family regulator